jgi:uncharacterized protein
MAWHFTHPHLLTDIPAWWSAAWGDQAVQNSLQSMVAQGLLVPAALSGSGQSDESDMLSAWLHLTDRCNLRCSYCYLPHQPTDMTHDTGYAAIAAIFRSALAHAYRRVKIKYAGGEPLLRIELIESLHRLAQQKARQHGLLLDGVVLSNGTLLTRQIVATLQKLGMRVMVSLDGLYDAHDQQRAFPNQRGSFLDIARNIEQSCADGLVPHISVTVTGHNAAQLPALVDWLIAHRLPFRLNIRRRLVADTPAVYEEEQQIIAGMRAAYATIQQSLSGDLFLASLLDHTDTTQSSLRPCIAGQDYLVFDETGNVSACQMHLRHPVTTTNAVDPLAPIRADTFSMQNPSVEEKADCRACIWKHWCAGGCPLETFRITGSFTARSPNCGIYTALYPELLRLEGLRLLHSALRDRVQ